MQICAAQSPGSSDRAATTDSQQCPNEAANCSRPQGWCLTWHKTITAIGNNWRPFLPGSAGRAGAKGHGGTSGTESPWGWPCWWQGVEVPLPAPGCSSKAGCEPPTASQSQLLRAIQINPSWHPRVWKGPVADSSLASVLLQTPFHRFYSPVAVDQSFMIESPKLVLISSPPSRNLEQSYCLGYFRTQHSPEVVVSFKSINF